MRYLQISRTFFFSCLFLCGLALSLPAFAADTDRNETIEGKVVKVVPSKKEIYVLFEGQKYEYYFKPETKLLCADKSECDFSQLKEGSHVRVSALKIGKRRDPLSVEILE